jgi:thiol-disulfide isomerase/thioredoxin
MALTPSTMLPLGTVAPALGLLDTVSGQAVDLPAPGEAAATLVMFICNHCPYVVHVMDGLDAVAGDYLPRGVRVIAINSNSAQTHPQDGPAYMKRLAQERGWAFPFAFDATQSVAKAYRAACTPDFYVFDRDLKLTYRGRLDSSRPNSGVPVTGADLRAALDATLEGQPVLGEQWASMGCNIKWQPGQEPDYFG